VPLLVAAKQASLDSGAEIVGIGIDSADKIREFARNYRINYPLLIADARALELIRGLGNRAGALPYTVALDRSGAVVDRHLGALKEAELRQVLARLRG
jgi:peroxiredoxin